MKHLLADFFYVLMTDRPDVTLFIVGARVASRERKNVLDVRFFFPLFSRKSKTLDRRLENK